MSLLLVPFLLLAGVGLALSAIAHVAALGGWPQPLGPYTMGLHAGIFIVWLPTVIVTHRLVRGADRTDFWKVALRGCPAWVRWAFFGIFGYGIVNFLWCALTAPPAGPKGKPGFFAEAPPGVVRMFSGHWMIFYAAALAVLWSTIALARAGKLDAKPAKGRGDDLDELIA